MLVTKTQYDSMGVGRNRCTKLVGFLQASFVLHKAIPIYLFAITFKAICIKKKSGEFERVVKRYRDLIVEAAP